MKTGTTQEMSLIHERGGRVVETLDAHTIVWFLACGYCVDTPSNSWLYWNARHKPPDTDDHHDYHRDDDDTNPHRETEEPYLNGEEEIPKIEDPDDPDHPDYDLDLLDDFCFGDSSNYCPWSIERDEMEGGIDSGGCGGCGGCGSCGTSGGVGPACGTSGSNCGTSTGGGCGGGGGTACGAGGGSSCGGGDDDGGGGCGAD